MVAWPAGELVAAAEDDDDATVFAVALALLVPSLEPEPDVENVPDDDTVELADALSIPAVTVNGIGLAGYADASAAPKVMALPDLPVQTETSVKWVRMQCELAVSIYLLMSEEGTLIAAAFSTLIVMRISMTPVLALGGGVTCAFWPNASDPPITTHGVLALGGMQVNAIVVDVASAPTSEA